MATPSRTLTRAPSQNGLSFHHPSAGELMQASQPAAVPAPPIAYVAGVIQPMMLNTAQVAIATERYARLPGANFSDEFEFTYTEED